MLAILFGFSPLEIQPVPEIQDLWSYVLPSLFLYNLFSVSFVSKYQYIYQEILSYTFSPMLSTMMIRRFFSMKVRPEDADDASKVEDGESSINSKFSIYLKVPASWAHPSERSPALPWDYATG